MTKAKYLKTLQELYRVANRADHETAEAWTHHTMADYAGCSGFDTILHHMLAYGVITEADRADFYDTL